MSRNGWRVTANYRADMAEAMEYASSGAIAGIKRANREDRIQLTVKGWYWPEKMLQAAKGKPVKPRKNHHKGLVSIRTATTGYDEERQMLDEMAALDAFAV